MRVPSPRPRPVLPSLLVALGTCGPACGRPSAAPTEPPDDGALLDPVAPPAAPAAGGVPSLPAPPAAEPGECQRDADCAGSDCNAPARCEAGRCAPGAPCENPDPLHCAVECVRAERRADCLVRGADSDGDGHGDQRCDAAPGDDCNDADRQVHGEATERCNGADDDCDGKVDLDDGLELAQGPTLVHEPAGPGSVLVVEHQGALAVLHGDREYAGRAWASPTLHFDPSGGDAGAAASAPIPIVGLSFFEPALHSDGETLWLTGLSPRGQMVARDVLSTEVVVELGASLGAALGGGSDPLSAWHSLSPGSTGLHVRALNRPDEPITLLASSAAPNASAASSIARGTEGFAVAWVQATLPRSPPGFSAAVRVSVQSSAEPSLRDLTLATYAQDASSEREASASLGRLRPLVAFTGTRYVAAWFDLAGVLQVAAFDPDGTVACGPEPQPAITGSTNVGHALVARGAEGQALLSYAAPDDTARALVINGACRLQGAPITLTAPDRKLVRGRPLFAGDEGTIGQPAVTATDSGFAFAWIEEPRGTSPDAGVDGGGEARAPDGGTEGRRYFLVTRRLGTLLCD